MLLSFTVIFNHGLLSEINSMDRWLDVWIVCVCMRAQWHSGTVVERRSLAGELSLSCARPAADG